MLGQAAFYEDRLYPQVVSLLGDPAPIQRLRQRLIPLAHGTVLEIGVGPGGNLPYLRAHLDRAAKAPDPGAVRRSEHFDR